MALQGQNHLINNHSQDLSSVHCSLQRDTRYLFKFQQYLNMIGVVFHSWIVAEEVKSEEIKSKLPKITHRVSGRVGIQAQVRRLPGLRN